MNENELNVDLIKLRYDLAMNRCREVIKEETVGENYRDYFKKCAEFILLIDEVKSSMEDGSYYRGNVESRGRNKVCRDI